MTVIFFGATSFRRGLFFGATFSPLLVFWFVSSLFGSLSYVPIACFSTGGFFCAGLGGGVNGILHFDTSLVWIGFGSVTNQIVSRADGLDPHTLHGPFIDVRT